MQTKFSSHLISELILDRKFQLAWPLLCEANPWGGHQLPHLHQFRIEEPKLSTIAIDGKTVLRTTIIKFP